MITIPEIIWGIPGISELPNQKFAQFTDTAGYNYKKTYITDIKPLQSFNLSFTTTFDNGAFFNDSEKSELSNRLQNIKGNSSVEILIFTTMDLGGKTPLDYGEDLSLRYPTGKKGLNNGITILLSKNDSRLQILNGYGLEWIITDNQSRQIIDQMLPYFKKGEFYNGVNKAIDLINAKVIDVDWKSYKPDKLSNIENGKIFKIQHSNTTGDTKYKYAIDTDPQFSDDFKIKLTLDGNDFNLYYSKHMNDLISKILTKDKISVYFRLSDFNSKRLELIGIE